MLLFWALTLLGLVAIVATPFSDLFRVIFCIPVLVLGAYRILACRHPVIITHHDTDDFWLLRRAKGLTLEGKLIDAGYRSAFVVVLVIQTDHLSCHRFPVWRDQLPGADFSYLHHQLQFNTVPRKRGSWLIFAGRLNGKPHGKLVQ